MNNLIWDNFVVLIEYLILNVVIYVYVYVTHIEICRAKIYNNNIGSLKVKELKNENLFSEERVKCTLILFFLLFIKKNNFFHLFLIQNRHSVKRSMLFKFLNVLFLLNFVFLCRCSKYEKS